MTRRRFGRALLVVLVGCAVVWLWTTTGGPIRVQPASESADGAGLVLTSARGERIAVDDLRGRIVVINLWASWCGPCVREIPALARLDEAFGARGVVVIGINADGVGGEELASLAANLGASYRVATAAAPLPPAYRTEGLLPHTWILDRAGRIRSSHAGAASYRAFERAVVALLEEGGAGESASAARAAVAGERLASRIPTGRRGRNDRP